MPEVQLQGHNVLYPFAVRLRVLIFNALAPFLVQNTRSTDENMMSNGEFCALLQANYHRMCSDSGAPKQNLIVVNKRDD